MCSSVCVCCQPRMAFWVIDWHVVHINMGAMQMSCRAGCCFDVCTAASLSQPNPNSALPLQVFLTDVWWWGQLVSLQGGLAGVRFEPPPLGEGAIVECCSDVGCSDACIFLGISGRWGAACRSSLPR